jgi:hypothetical protein
MMCVLLASPWATREDEAIARVIGIEIARLDLGDEEGRRDPEAGEEP